MLLLNLKSWSVPIYYPGISFTKRGFLKAMPITSIDLQKGQKIDSLQALRALAFLGIFLEHAKFPYNWPAFGVSIFFVMSGFLMTYRYESVEIGLSPKNCFLFSWNKIKKLYPLHIITMLLAAILITAKIANRGFNAEALIDLCGKLILHSTLLQTLVPKWTISISLNEPAWFFSATSFLYFGFPWIKRVVEQYSLGKLCTICILILLAEVLACIPIASIFGTRSEFYIWFMYCFPVFRAVDFFVGCVLKRVFFESKVKNIGTITATFLELLATAFTISVFFWCAEGHNDIVLKALNNWTTPYIPLAAVWIILFATNKGLLTKALTNKVSIAVGNISAYAFLIHFIITMYTPYIVSRMGITVSGWHFTVLVFIELAVSIALSACYKYFDEKYISKHFFFRKNKTIRA